MNTTDILNEQIADHQSAIDEAKAKLAELDKPKLRHGDYGYDESGRPTLVCKKLCGEVHAGQSNGFLEHIEVNNLHDCKPKTILGNIFDDIARNQEDLWEFGVSGMYDNKSRKTFRCDLHASKHKVWLHINTGSSFATI
ncbi:MAG: hypothetical protein KAS32_29840, partial [Candidatus Peribacteraceae bacterium]|nr:hypothetical protein [Candidatus Peribacteraceae bacterium]